MSYSEVDRYIRTWAGHHSLKVFTSLNGHAVRVAYVSSQAGECFQISIDEPKESYICIYASCVEGRREDHPAYNIQARNTASTL